MTNTNISGIDNSALIPKALPNVQVKMEGMSPDWVKTLIMVQFRIESVTEEGTCASATQALDHCAETGINGLWINPVYERGSKGNGYGNFGPHTIEPLLTGKSNIEDSYKEMNKFVAEAHKRNIRVLFDIIVWGTAKGSPLVTEHPEFYKKKDGEFVPSWGGWAFNWDVPELRAWFTNAAVTFIEKTGADGFRVDLAPDTSGYYFKEIRDACYTKGHKIAIIAEMTSERRDTFDFEQVSVHGYTEEPAWGNPEKRKAQIEHFGEHNAYLFHSNIVDAVKTGVGIGKATLQQQGQGGMYRFYASNLICHDDHAVFVRGNRVRFAYATIFAPFIPLWWIGEEWDNPKNSLVNPQKSGVLYFNAIDWSVRNGAGKTFFEDAKRYIAIRRSYPEIFEYFPEHLRDSNIVKLETTYNGSPNTLQAYGRYGGGKAVLVVPNYKDDKDSQDNKAGTEEKGENEKKVGTRFDIKPDYAALGLSGAQRYKITDLMTGKVTTGIASDLKSFTADIPADHLGVYLVERD